MHLGIIGLVLLNFSPIVVGYCWGSYAAGRQCVYRNHVRTTRAPSYRYYSRRTTTQRTSHQWSSSRRTSSTERPYRPVWKPTAWEPDKTKSFTVLPHFIKRIRFSTSETFFGTKFNNEMKKLFSKKIPTKLFGLGVGPAFVGGAGFSFGAGLVSYSVYHRYTHFRKLLHDNGYLDKWDEGYYSDLYEQ